MRKLRSLILIIILIQFSSFIASPPDDGEGLTHFPSPDSLGGVGASVASEEENIDSFDVNPKSGRWNVTNDNNTDDLVTDSILRMTTTNNMTSDGITDAVGYEMNRGLTKTDGKVEYRMAASGGGNQSEFSRDIIGNKWDFEEDEDGWVNVEGAAEQSNGLYVWTVVGASVSFRQNDLNISTDVFKSFEIKLKSSDSSANLRIFDFNAANRLFEIEAISDTNWNVYTFDVPRVTWSGVIEGILINLQSFDGIAEFEYIKLIGDLDYATHIEDEIEDTWDWAVDNSTESWAGLDNMNVSEGFLRGTMAAAGFDFFDSPAGLSIDTDLFDFLIIRMNTSDDTMNFQTQANIDGFVVITDIIDFDNTSFHLFKIDLSGVSNWDGTASQLRIKFDEDDDTLDGDEIVFIDYILLLGHWADSDSVIGLFDQDNLVSLLNISTVFTSNNFHTTTSDKAYFTVELLDLDGDIAYSAISDNYTDISDLWIRAKITFDVLRSKLTVTITVDNTTRIDKWTFPQDFTEVSGRIPALFSHEKSPDIFTSTFCQAISWQEMRLDYIKADYKEREWSQISSPSDANWLYQNWDGIRIEDDINNEFSNWSINIPSLDSVSGVMRSEIVNFTQLDVADKVLMSFDIFGVDSDDGELHRIVRIRLTRDNTPLVASVFFEILDENGASYFVVGRQLITTNPKVSFSVSLIKERSILAVKARLFYDETDESDFNDALVNVTVANIVDVVSQEFVLQSVFVVDQFTGNTEANLLYEDFGFTQRDIFSDIVDAIIKPLGNFFQQIFVGLFRFFADIFRVVGDLITAGITVMQGVLSAAILTMQTVLAASILTMQTAVTGAINQIQGWLTALGTTISTAIDQIEGWLTAIATTISEAIADIAADIWTAFGTVAADIMDDIVTALTALAADFADFVDGVIQFLIPLLLAIVEDIAGLLVGIIDELLLIGGDILSGIITFVAGIVFFIWEALGLPDVLAILDVLLTSIFDTITSIPQAILDLMGFFTPLFIIILSFYWVWLIFLAFAQEGFDPFAGLAEFFGRLLATVPIPIPMIGSIPFPIALFFIPLTYFLILPPESVFAIW